MLELAKKLLARIVMCWPGAVTALLCTAIVHADVIGVDVDATVAVPVPGVDYERVSGVLHFSFDPGAPHNAMITDLARAPRDTDGLVRASAQFMVLRPRSGGSGVAVLEVSNRGGQASLRYFQNGTRYEGLPETAAHYGDGLLMRQGVTLIWVGWQFDVPCEPGRLRAALPIATRDGARIAGLLRADWTLTETHPVLQLGHRDHWTYPVIDPAAVLLSYRRSREAQRVVVPDSEWSFAGHGESDLFATSYTSIVAQNDFRPGIYELTYLSAHPRVVGLGLAIVRDTMIYARSDADSIFPARTGVAFGVSQTGRFLRHFLYQGFNLDRDGKRVFDGMLIHSAGAGRGSFNHRFAQPSRDGHQNSAFLYPTDLFPFSGRTQSDHVSGRRDGLLARYSAEQMPKIMYTNTGYEYWGRAASLTHTSLYQVDDLPPLDNERIYAIASAQHYQEHWPPRDSDRIDGTRVWRGNPAPFLINLRALMLRLLAWTDSDEPPPDSRYPRFENYTLTPVAGLRLPRLEGITRPATAHIAYRANYGRRFASRGIIDIDPPLLGRPYTTYVPQNDVLGNESGGIVNSWVSEPLATYLSWHKSGPTTLTDFRGAFAPFLPVTDRDSGDPRPAVSQLYFDRDEYLTRAGNALDELIDDGFVLAVDKSRVLQHHTQLWDWIQEN